MVEELTGKVAGVDGRVKGDMKKKIICPICNKDLTKALKLIGADFRLHMNVHIEVDGVKVWCYLNINLEKLPEKLKMLVIKRKENIEKLHAYKEELENRGEEGYGGG
ncbi:hypothetical protein LCGC14_1732070 [marine sediment metagenome]|uniref:Uncharacterized protein n=1 Tax=marine sediment metagenome TaxID=412755 RepID=A0A0F9JPQ0_9ZZZZ